MDLSNYLKILEESITKKLSLLQALLEATKRQSQIADNEEFDLAAFQGTVDQKDVLIEQIQEVDEGFESVFGQIRNDLMDQKNEYKDGILKIQDMIRKCTDLGVELQTMEERNHKRLESVFANQKKEIRQVKANSKMVSNYYRSMRPSTSEESLFMDQKK